MTDLDQFRDQFADRVAAERADLSVRTPDIDAIVRDSNRGRRRTRTMYGTAALVAASAVVAVAVLPSAVLPGASPTGNESLPAGPAPEEATEPGEVTHYVDRPPTPSGNHDYSKSRPDAPDTLSYDGEVLGLGTATVPDYGGLPRADDLKLGWLAVDDRGCAWFVAFRGEALPLLALEGSRITPDGVSLRGDFGDVLVAPGEAIAGDGHYVDTAQGVLGDPACAVSGRGFLAVPYRN